MGIYLHVAQLSCVAYCIITPDRISPPPPPGLRASLKASHLSIPQVWASDAWWRRGLQRLRGVGEELGAIVGWSVLAGCVLFMFVLGVSHRGLRCRSLFHLVVCALLNFLGDGFGASLAPRGHTKGALGQFVRRSQATRACLGMQLTRPRGSWS